MGRNTLILLMCAAQLGAADCTFRRDPDEYLSRQMAGAWANDGMLKAAPALKQVRAGKGIVGAVEFEMPLRPNLRTGDFYLAQRREDAVIGSTLEFDKFDRKVDRAKLAALHAAAEWVRAGAAGGE